MNYVTKVISSQEKDKLIEFYKDKKIDFKGEYLIFAAQEENVKIFIYESKKGYKVSYQGQNALYEAKIFFPDAKENVKKQKTQTKFLDFNPQIGSDEVGTGDLFGPMVVCACYFSHDVFEKFPNLKINDSKKLTDKDIVSICEEIMPDLVISKYTLMPEKYNQLIEKGFSMNAIKAILHNKALTSLTKKINYNNIYIDEFCSKENFYKYVINANEVPLKNICFQTKGESHYPSVALASMIARYSFLKTMEKMNIDYAFTFPKGASKKCDDALKEFVSRYGKEKLKYVAKLNFKNIKNVL